MISQFKFYSDLNFYLKNKESFVVYKKPSHNKVICLHGDAVDMPFDSEKKGYLLTPNITTETEFHLKISNNSNQQVSIKEFNSKKNSYINFSCLKRSESLFSCKRNVFYFVSITKNSC